MSGGTGGHGTGLAAASAAVAAAGGVAFAVAFWNDRSIQWQGGSLALAFAGLAVALGAIGRRVAPGEDVEEDRAPLVTSGHEREALRRTLLEGAAPLRRRPLLLALLGGAAAVVGAVLVFPIRSLGSRPSRQLFRTSWSAGARLVTEGGEPVRADALAIGGFLTVWPEGAVGAADSHVVLIRARSGDIRARPGREAWSPMGHVAYSKTCTHAGCPVGLYDQRTQQLFCPCEQAVFDVTDGAEPVAGPAPRPLPQLPLYVDAGGFLRARGDFEEPVGPGFWERGG